MTHTAVNPARGEVVVEDADGPFPEEICFSAEDSTGGEWIAAKRWARGQCSAGLQCVGDRGPLRQGFDGVSGPRGRTRPP